MRQIGNISDNRNHNRRTSRNRSQVGIGSESDCLLGQLKRIFEISDSEAGLKVEKSGGVAGGEGKCGDAVVKRAARERRSLDIVSVKKDAKLSASDRSG